MNEHELLTEMMAMQATTRQLAIAIIATLISEDKTRDNVTDEDTKMATTIYDNTFDVGFAVGKVAQHIEMMP